MSTDDLTYRAEGAPGGEPGGALPSGVHEGAPQLNNGEHHGGYEPTKFDERAMLIDKQKLCDVPEIYRYRLQAPRIAHLAKPGQFVSLKPENSTQFLRIPLAVYAVHASNDCVCNTDANAGEYNDEHHTENVGKNVGKNVGEHHIENTPSLDVVFQVVGAGTTELANVDLGKYIYVQGPLGNGWGVRQNIDTADTKDANNKKVLLIAGGMGAAALYLLAEQLKAKGYKLDVVLGAANKDLQVFMSSFEGLASNLYITTDDGSAGTKGFVTAISDDLIVKNDYAQIYMCGPYPMMAAATKAALAKDAPCQVSLERLMACGVGVCLSCVTKTTSGLKRVCADGPVFDIKELIWN